MGFFNINHRRSHCECNKSPGWLCDGCLIKLSEQNIQVTAFLRFWGIDQNDVTEEDYLRAVALLKWRPAPLPRYRIKRLHLAWDNPNSLPLKRKWHG